MERSTRNRRPPCTRRLSERSVRSSVVRFDKCVSIVCGMDTIDYVKKYGVHSALCND